MNVMKVERHGDVVVVILDNPPVNALSHAVRAALQEAVLQAEADASIRAIVLGAAGRIFCAGADIGEFDHEPREPVLSRLLMEMDELTKPVVAAIGGAALGGGLELALACDARIAAPGASFGLPEVKLGLLPGAGGTQRLPRLVGGVTALEMIGGGEPRSAQVALGLCVIDRVVEGEGLIAAAVETARALAGEGRRRTSTRSMASAELPAFEEKAATLLKKHDDAPEIRAIVDSVRNTFHLDFAAGCRTEQALFQTLRQGARPRALRHAFFAERRSAHVEGVPAKPQQRIETVAVIGGGTMGGGIAMSFANADIPVTIVETDAEAAARAAARLDTAYETSVRRGSLSREDKTLRLSLISTQVGLEHARDADLIVEAAFEDMAVKRDIFARLDGVARQDAIVATNTSYLDVDAIAACTGRPANVLGMHFFSPANVMRLVEVVRGQKTSPEVLARVLEVSRRLGKIPVVVGVCHGFVGNRMLARRSQQVDRMLLEGATPGQIDAALTAFGFRMGPCAMSDLAGLDISWRMRKATGRRAPIADALCEIGRFGQKTGTGYYAYPQGSRTGVDDPLVLSLMEEVSAREGVRRRAIGDEEVMERMVYPMIDEGARILAEGVATRGSDIDVVWLHGYNWPRWRGGPMHYAREIGPATISQRLGVYATEANDASLQPFDGLVAALDRG